MIVDRWPAIYDSMIFSQTGGIKLTKKLKLQITRDGNNSRKLGKDNSTPIALPTILAAFFCSI